MIGFFHCMCEALKNGSYITMYPVFEYQLGLKADTEGEEEDPEFDAPTLPKTE